MPDASTHESSVLVVDDCEALCFLKTHYLLEAGYRVSQAGTGSAAIRSMEAERADLVLLDVNLPDMHGAEVCRQVKTRWALPVIFTSSVEIPLELHVMAEGCLVSLDEKELLDTVRRVLDGATLPVPQPNGGQVAENTGFSRTVRSSPQEIAAQARIFDAGMLRDVLDTSRAFTIVANRNREIVFCNRAALRLAGVESSQAALGLRLEELFHCAHGTKSPDGCGTTGLCPSCHAMAAVLDGSRPNISSCEWQVFRCVNGVEEACDLQVTASPIEGREEFVVCTLVESSHEKRRQAIERMFFHDILNIAGGVKGLAAMLCDELKGGSNAELAGEVEQCADNLVKEIRTRQQLSVAASGQLALKPAAVGAPELVRTAAAQHRGALPGTHDSRRPAFRGSPDGDRPRDPIARTW
jgi:CheY-like chemotaxis protein